MSPLICTAQQGPGNRRTLRNGSRSHSITLVRDVCLMSQIMVHTCSARMSNASVTDLHKDAEDIE